MLSTPSVLSNSVMNDLKYEKHKRKTLDIFCFMISGMRIRHTASGYLRQVHSEFTSFLADGFGTLAIFVSWFSIPDSDYNLAGRVGRRAIDYGSFESLADRPQST